MTTTTAPFCEDGRARSVSPLDDLAPRLTSGRPLLLGGDVRASLRARGLALGDATFGRAVREQADLADSHYEVEVRAGADVVSTLTADTTPRALASSGMAFRAAALTGRTVDRALEIAERAGRPVAVAGVLDGRDVIPEHWEEVAAHAARLAAAGVHLIVARGFEDEGALRFAIASGRATGLPVWAVVDASWPDLAAASALLDADGSLLLVRANTPSAVTRAVERLRGVRPSLRLGGLLDASIDAREGTPGDLAPTEWATRALALTSLDLRALGGGRGSTHEHTTELAFTLRRAMPSLAPPP